VCTCVSVCPLPQTPLPKVPASVIEHLEHASLTEQTLGGFMASVAVMHLEGSPNNALAQTLPRPIGCSS
jgi:hypothetical protein